MGIENREYYRDDRPSSHWGERPGRSGNSWSAVTWIMVFTIGCFVAQLVLGPRFTALFLLNPEWVRAGAVWQLLTYAFLHSTSNIWHIVFNMWVLHMSGRDFEIRRGSAEFIAFYLFAAVFAGLTVFLWESVMGDDSPVLGASGAVSALLMVLAFTYPQAEVRVFGLLPMRMITFAIGIIVLDTFPLLLEITGNAPRGDGPRIAHSAHLGGIVLGILYQKQNWRVLDWLPLGGGGRSWTRWLNRSPKLKVHRPEEPAPTPAPPDFDRRVDDLLDKVAREGEASLTEAERQILVEASRRARDRMSR